ncbi:hypothetical protein ACC734_40300, partial [Rhizobium ruizarguesonis]
FKLPQAETAFATLPSITTPRTPAVLAAAIASFALFGANSARQNADFINAGADESFVRPISTDHLLRALHSLSSLSG